MKILGKLVFKTK